MKIYKISIIKFFAEKEGLFTITVVVAENEKIEKIDITYFEPGKYKIGEKYFQMGGGFANTISWKGQGIMKELIPSSVLFHK